MYRVERCIIVWSVVGATQLSVYKYRRPRGGQGGAVWTLTPPDLGGVVGGRIGKSEDILIFHLP